MKNDMHRKLVEGVTYEHECLRRIVDEIVGMCNPFNPSDGFNRNLEGLNQTVELLTLYVRSICTGREEETEVNLPALFQNAIDYYRTKLRSKKVNVRIRYKWTHLVPESVDPKGMSHEERLPYINEAIGMFRFRASEQMGLFPFLVLDNAIKYSPGNSTVDVVLDAEKRQVSVSNYGPVISDADFEHLFDKGFRGEKAMERTPDEGMGLGLYFLDAIMKRSKCRLYKEKNDLDEFKGKIGYSRFTLIADFNSVHYDGGDGNSVIASSDTDFSTVLTDIFLHEYNNMIAGLNAQVNNLGVQINNVSCGVSQVERLPEAYERLRFAYFRFLLQLSLFAFYFNPAFLQVSTCDYEIDIKNEFRRAFEYYRRRIGNYDMSIDVQLTGERHILGRVKPRPYDLFDEQSSELHISARNVIREVPLLIFDFIRINSLEEPDIELTLTAQTIKGAHVLVIEVVFSCHWDITDLYDGYYDPAVSRGGIVDSISNLILDLLAFYMKENKSLVRLEKKDDRRLGFHIVL